VDETIKALLQDVRDKGIEPSAIRFTSNVTALPDDHVAIVVERMAAAGFTTDLVDDRIPPRPGTIRSGNLPAHEVAVMDQASAARAELERQRAR
jgi:hypothetical protein